MKFESQLSRRCFEKENSAHILYTLKRWDVCFVLQLWPKKSLITGNKGEQCILTVEDNKFSHLGSGKYTSFHLKAFLPSRESNIMEHIQFGDSAWENLMFNSKVIKPQTTDKERIFMPMNTAERSIKKYYKGPVNVISTAVAVKENSMFPIRLSVDRQQYSPVWADLKITFSKENLTLCSFTHLTNSIDVSNNNLYWFVLSITGRYLSFTLDKSNHSFPSNFLVAVNLLGFPQTFNRHLCKGTSVRHSSRRTERNDCIPVVISIDINARLAKVYKVHLPVESLKLTIWKQTNPRLKHPSFPKLITRIGQPERRQSALRENMTCHGVGRPSKKYMFEYCVINMTTSSQVVTQKDYGMFLRWETHSSRISWDEAREVCASVGLLPTFFDQQEVDEFSKLLVRSELLPFAEAVHIGLLNNTQKVRSEPQ